MSHSTMQRKINSSGLAAVAAVALMLFGAARPAEATTVPPMDAAKLADRAEIVFTGTAVRSTVVLSKDGAEPYTFVTFDVHEVLKGWTLDRQLTLRFSGGEIGGGTVGFDGMPEFEQGETYLLFVRGNGSSLCPVLGWWQGQFRYSRQAGSQKEILVDSAGTPVHGLEQERFKRGLSKRNDGGMIVLSEQGVRVETDEQTASAEPPEAGQIVKQLRSFIDGRKAAQSYRPGRRVDSARTEDVPARSAFAAARSK
jgi:hypothetical protein